MTDELPPTGLADEHDISADIAPVHFAGSLDIYHPITSSYPLEQAFVPSDGRNTVIGFGCLQKMKRTGMTCPAIHGDPCPEAGGKKP
jgi:hypothetical protein